MVVIYPKEPYGKTDYSIDVILDCGFESEKQVLEKVLFFKKYIYCMMTKFKKYYIIIMIVRWTMIVWQKLKKMKKNLL